MSQLAESRSSSIRTSWGVALLGWNALRVIFIFFAGGVFLALAADVVVLAGSWALNAIYPNKLGQMTGDTLKVLPASPYLAFTVLFYFKGQFVNTLFALLSFAVLQRVSFWTMIVAAPIVAYAFEHSFAADWYWETARPSLGLTKFLALLAHQLFVTIICCSLLKAGKLRNKRRSDPQ